MREVRLCLEFAKESEFMARRDDRLIFYGQVKEKKFTQVRIVSFDSVNEGLDQFAWWCARSIKDELQVDL